MKDKYITFALIIYIIIGIITFGHGMNRLDKQGKDEIQIVVGGILVSAFWPLYWSYILWEEKS